MLTAPTSMLALLAALWRISGLTPLSPPLPPALAATMLAGAVLAAVLAVCLRMAAGAGRMSPAIPLAGRTAALREKAWRAAFLRQCDPDTAGRPRPRAPSAAPAAACS